MTKPTTATVQSTQLALFDYDQLDLETRIVVQQRTTEIRDRLRQTAQGLVEIGQRMAEVKERLPHGQFGPWVRAEFGMSDGHARKLMQVARAFGQNDHYDRFAPTALYLLAAPGTPDEAREEALERANKGEEIGAKEAKAIIASHTADVIPIQDLLIQLRDMLARLECHDAIPLLYGLPMALRGDWQRDVAQVRDVARAIAMMPEDAETLQHEISKINDPELRDALMRQYAGTDDLSPEEIAELAALGWVEVSRWLIRSKLIIKMRKGDDTESEEGRTVAAWRATIAATRKDREEAEAMRQRLSAGLVRGVQRPEDWEIWHDRAAAVGARLLQRIDGTYRLYQPNGSLKHYEDWDACMLAIAALAQSSPPPADAALPFEPDTGDDNDNLPTDYGLGDAPTPPAADNDYSNDRLSAYAAWEQRVAPLMRQMPPVVLRTLAIAGGIEVEYDDLPADQSDVADFVWEHVAQPIYESGPSTLTWIIGNDATTTPAVVDVPPPIIIADLPGDVCEAAIAGFEAALRSLPEPALRLIARLLSFDDDGRVAYIADQDGLIAGLSRVATDQLWDIADDDADQTWAILRQLQGAVHGGS